MRGADISALQSRLNALGADLVVDGVFGPETEAAAQTCELLHRRDRLASSAISTVIDGLRPTARTVSTQLRREAFDV